MQKKNDFKRFLCAGLLLALLGSGCEPLVITKTTTQQGMGQSSTTNEEATANDLFSKKVICEKYADSISEKIKRFNASQKVEIGDSSVPAGEGPPIYRKYLNNNLLINVFYSPKVDSCVYVESHRTLIAAEDATPGKEDWEISYETWYMMDVLTGAEIDFYKGQPWIQLIQRSEVFNTEVEAKSAVDKYR
ncbi:hypothetical protein K8R04_02965 [Candidatus Uhrbacteria bacterium]|nr:hypothetical protein [Candidatus Uhrbacteria bacterium]